MIDETMQDFPLSLFYLDLGNSYNFSLIQLLESPYKYTIRRLNLYFKHTPPL